MTKTNKIIIVIAGAVLIVLAAYFIFHKSQPEPQPVTIDDKIKEAIDSATAPLKRENDSLLIVNSQLEELNIDQQKQTDSLLNKIEESKNTILQIKKKYNEKLSAVKSFTPADIQSFLTNRYGNR